MNKVVSIALFGSGDAYAQYLSTFTLAHNNLSPREEGWRLHLACDAQLSDATKKLIARLYEAELLDYYTVHAAAPICKAMLWRMGPAFWPDQQSGTLMAGHFRKDSKLETFRGEPKFVFCRDLDAIPMPRDRACCDAFIANAEKYRCATHTIHDSQYHIGIMGGLCGFNAPMLRAITGWNTLDDVYKAAGYSDAEWAQKGADQLALNKLLLRVNGPRLFEHRFNGWHGGPGVQPARAAGVYACSGVSMPVPEHAPVTLSRANTAEEVIALLERADRLGNHLGCAGYNVEAARKFWFEHGDPEIAEKIRTCEVP